MAGLQSSDPSQKAMEGNPFKRSVGLWLCLWVMLQLDHLTLLGDLAGNVAER
jgi:hypothetical protein